MRRVFFVISLLLLTGCGSCFDDKKVPEVEQAPTIKTVTKTTEAGGKRPIQVGEGVDFAGLVKRDGGADGGT